MPDPSSPVRFARPALWVGVGIAAGLVSRFGPHDSLTVANCALLIGVCGVPLLAGLLLGRWGWLAVAVGGLAGAWPAGEAEWVGVGAATAAAVAAGLRCRRGWPFDPGLGWLADVRRLANLATEAAAACGLATAGLTAAFGFPHPLTDGLTAAGMSLAANVLVAAVAGGVRAWTGRPFVALLALAMTVGLTAWSGLPASAVGGLTAVTAGLLLVVAAVTRERLAEAALRDRLLTDLKTVSADLVRRRGAMEALLDQLPVGVLFLDGEGNVVRQNRQYRDALRLPTDFPELRPGEVTPSGRWHVARADGTELPAGDWSVYRAVREGRSAAEREARVRSADGTWRDVSVSSAPVTDPDTGGPGAVFVVADLTARKQAERDRQAAEERLRGGLHAARMYAWEWDQATDRLDIFGDFRRVAGLPPDYPVPDSSAALLQLIHAEDRQAREAAIAATQAGNPSEFEVEFRLVRPDGSTIWLASRGQAVCQPDGTTTGRLAGVTFDVTARKQAEARAAEAEAQARFALAAARMSAWDWDLATGRVTRSEPIHDWLGLPPEVPLNQVGSLAPLIHPDDRPAFDGEMPAARAGEEFDTVMRVRHADGTWRWLRSRGRGVVGPDGRVERIAGVHQDVTAERRAEERLRLLESAVVHARDAVVILGGDPAGGGGRPVRYVNAAFERMTGYPPEDVIGRSLSFLGGPASDPHALGRLRDALAAGRPLLTELLNYHRDGTPVWVELSLVPVPGPGGAVSHFVMIQRDVTDRKRAEEALRQSEERFRSMFENAAAGVSETAPDGTFTAVNPAFAALLGRATSDIVGRTPTAFTHPDDWTAQQPLLAGVWGGGRDEYRHAKRYLRPDGTVVWTELSAAVLRDAAGRPRSVLGVSVDVTERRRLEEQLLQAQKMEAVGQLAGGIAHDFNNLLTAVLGHLGLVAVPAGGPAREHLALAEKAAQRAADLTQKLLGFARKSQLLLMPTSAAGCVAEVLDLVRPNLGRDVALAADLAADDLVLADPALLGQVVLNLCLNARDAMPGGGTLSVGTAAVDVTPAEAATSPHGRPGPHVRIRVADTGTGMAPAVLARVFEPFFTTKEVGKGTGLGLAMVDGIIRQHDGWVAVRSEVGVGTRFDLYLKPAESSVTRSAVIKRSAVERPAPDLTATPPPPARGNTVLLVDDEEMIRLLGRSVLEAAGYTVLEAEDGADALDLFAARHADIDLVVLDLTMPRMSGREAYQRMAEIAPAARVLLSSGYSADDLSDVTGAVGLLAKPYRPAELIAAVRQALAGQPVS